MQKKAPRPGFEPGSKAPEASRMSTTLPRHYATMSMSGSRFHTNNVVASIKSLDKWKENGIITDDDKHLIDEYIIQRRAIGIPAQPDLLPARPEPG